MHVLMINGSPRVEKLSNTDKIIDAFGEGLKEAGASYEKVAISRKEDWEMIREAYASNTEIILALPLYVECLPGILLEFLETLPRKDQNTRLSFILQSGFSEASQLRCGEAYLKTLPERLGLAFGGVLIKGDNFSIRIVNKEDADKITGPYRALGKAFVVENGFLPDTVKQFAGPEYFSLPIRLMLQVIFKIYGVKRFEAVAKEWGSKVPIDYKPWK